ncbi:MAG: CopG family transcriptional regulator [Pseudomonadota bacterium]
MPSTNPRIRPYISPDNHVRLKALAELPGRGESEIVDKALAAFFSHEHDDKRDGALIRRLDRMTRQMEGLKRNQIIYAEAFALFMRYFLTVIPPVSEADKAAAQAQGADRYEKYLKSLRTVLADGERILFDVVDDLIVDESAFFTAEELARLHEPAPSAQKEAADA